MCAIFVLAAVLLAACVLLARAPERIGEGSASPPATTRAPAAVAGVSTQSQTVVLSPGGGGHFWTEARVDGCRLQLVVDTGASQVALRASDAARLGLHPKTRDFSVRVATANGTTRAAAVDLGTVEVGNIVVRDVRALVHGDDTLGVNLLGMFFLSRVRRTHQRGKLILEQ